MDTHLLIAFVAVAEHKTFTAAAQQLHLTQSAISKRIALLERHLGQVLFDRVGRTICLTESGAALLPRAKSALQEIESALQSVRDFSEAVGGRLRIATSHHIGIHRLPAVLRQYVDRYPDVHLDLHFVDSERAVESVLQGEYELAFVTLSEKITADSASPLQYCLAWRDPLAFVCGHNHPLACRKRVRLSDLSQHPAILPERQAHTTQLVQRCFRQQDLSVEIQMTTNHLDAIRMMISLGLGWSVLPYALLSDDLTALPIKQRLTRELGCVYRRDRTLTKAARAMLTLLA